MAGVYPGIASLCMLALTKKTLPLIKKILLVAAYLQLLAWGCDIAENYFLLKWIITPEISAEFKFYQFAVIAKWIIALAGVIIAVPMVIFNKRK